MYSHDGVDLDALTALIVEHADKLTVAASRLAQIRHDVTMLRANRDRLERILRAAVEGRNQQERDDHLATLCDRDGDWQAMTATILAYQRDIGAIEGEIERHKLLARAYTAVMAALR